MPRLSFSLESTEKKIIFAKYARYLLYQLLFSLSIGYLEGLSPGPNEDEGMRINEYNMNWRRMNRELMQESSALILYSAMHKKRYKFYNQDFYAQKSLKKLLSIKNPKSWKKWSNWHQSQTFRPIWVDFIINWKLGVVNWCKTFKWLLKLTLIISRFFELTLNW